MSKLIVEMDMPKRCIECGVRLKCKRYVCGLQQNIADVLKPLIGDKDCLIKDVLPEEHGDLIDRDEVKQKMIHYGFRAIDMTATEFCEDELQTVIAAERSET